MVGIALIAALVLLIVRKKGRDQDDLYTKGDQGYPSEGGLVIGSLTQPPPPIVKTPSECCQPVWACAYLGSCSWHGQPAAVSDAGTTASAVLIQLLHAEDADFASVPSGEAGTQQGWMQH